MNSKQSIPHYETFQIESKSVNETRTINVWQPENSTNLPVIYMTDGGINESFLPISLLFSELIHSKQIPPFMLIGIENTIRNRDLTSKTSIEKDEEIVPINGGSEDFRSFLLNELIPEIEKKYSVSKIKGLVGESLAGLFVMETFLKKTDSFDYYLAFDPSLWWNDYELIKTAQNYLNHFSKHQKILWISTSKVKNIKTPSEEFIDNLDQENFLNLTYHYLNDAKANHFTIYRRTREKAFIWTLNQIIHSK